MNDNCLTGYRCPECGSEGPFEIETVGLCSWTDDGVDYPFEPTFKEDGYWSCSNCEFEGREVHFRNGFLKWLESRIDPKKQRKLDELVHELAAERASRINNQSVYDQVEFIADELLEDAVGTLRDLMLPEAENESPEETEEETP